MTDGFSLRRSGDPPALVHGAYSEGRIRAKARAHRRRFYAGLGVHARDLDLITRELVRHWARGQAQLDLFDASGERGTRNYWTAYNASTRVLRRLEERVRELGLDVDARRNGTRALEAHLRERYGDGEGAS